MILRAVCPAFALIFALSAAAFAALTFPTLTGRVVDDAGILDGATREDLTQTLAALESKTTDQLVVVTLKSLQGTSIEDYGYQLGRTWAIGQKGKNNGLLLIVVPSERKVRIEVGYGLEGTVTDAVARLIIENAIIPKFKAGDMPGGIKSGVEELVRTLTPNPGGATSPSSGSYESVSEPVLDGGGNAAGNGWTITAIVLGVVMLLIFCALVSGLICQIIFQILLEIAFSGGSSRGGGGGGGGGFSGGGGSFGGGGASGSW